MSLLTKRDPLDLATLAVADRPDVLAARASRATALAEWKAGDALLRECWREQGGNDGALSGPNELDALKALEARQREPDLRRDGIRLKIALERAELHCEAIEKAGRIKCKAARVAGLKALVRELFDALDAVVPVNAALVKYEAETAALLGGPPEPFDSHAWATEFDGDEARESVLEFRKRRAIEAGLL